MRRQFGKNKTSKPLPKPTYNLTYYNSTLGFFSKVYSRSDMKWRLGMLAISGLLYAFVSIVFIQNTGLYTPGLSGIIQGSARLIRIGVGKSGAFDANFLNLIYTIIFYIVYLVVNIPLIIFSYKKMSKKFAMFGFGIVAISTILPLIVNQIIPGVGDFFIFGSVRIDDPQFQDVQLLNFEDPEHINKFILLFLYTLFAGLINGFAASIVYAIGGCTGGLDFISFYYSYKKKKPIKKILFLFNSVSTILSTFIGSYLASGITDSQNFTIFTNFLSQNLIVSIFYVIILSLVINNFFPKDKIIKLQIYCDDIYAIRNYLYEINFNHAITINQTIGGYSLEQKKNIEIVCLFIELPKILRTIKTIKQKMLITIIPLQGIDGNLAVENAFN